MTETEDTQSLIAALLRRYLITEDRSPSADWHRVDDWAHIAGMRRILETLEGDSLPATGDPLAIIELEWRGVHAKHRAFSRYDAAYLDNPHVLEEMAQVMRRWPSLRFEGDAFGALCPGQYETCVGLSELLEKERAVALDGVRAKLRYELEMRDVWEEAGGAAASPVRGLLERSILILDKVCADPMLELGYEIAARIRSDDTPPEIQDLEVRADGLHATTLEGALVHVMLALSHLDRSPEASACQQHMARACRVLEAHTGLILEEVGGRRPDCERHTTGVPDERSQGELGAGHGLSPSPTPGRAQQEGTAA